MAIFFCIFLTSRYRNSTPEIARMWTYFMAKADIKKESRIFYPLLPKHVSNTKSLKTHIKLIIPTRSNTCIIISIILCRPDRIAYAIQASCSRFSLWSRSLLGISSLNTAELGKLTGVFLLSNMNFYIIVDFKWSLCTKPKNQFHSVSAQIIPHPIIKTN